MVIGITSTAKYLAPRLIADFARRFPRIDITLSVGNRLEVLNSLRRLAVDIAIMGRPPEEIDLVSQPFGNHPLLIIGPPEHALAGRRNLSKADVATAPFLMREEGSGARTVFEEVFRGPVNRRSRFRIEIGSNETIRQGVMAGLGIALISAHTGAFETQTGRLTVSNVVGRPIHRKWFATHKADKTALPAMRAFWNFTHGRRQASARGYLERPRDMRECDPASRRD